MSYYLYHRLNYITFEVWLRKRLRKSWELPRYSIKCIWDGFQIALSHLFTLYS